MDYLKSTLLFIPILSALGIGGILGAYFQSLFQHRKELKADLHELKRKRYLSILIQMLTVLDPERGLVKIKEFRNDFSNLEDVKQELKTEMMNAILFADDGVIKSMAEFLKNQTNKNYIRSAVAMRKDLWDNKTRIEEDIFKDFL